MGNKLFIQLVLLFTSVMIVVTYIQPSFTEIADVQDDIARYESTIVRAAELNAALQELVATERSLSSREREALSTYLPNEIDDVVIMRDIQNIFKAVDLPINGLRSVSSEGRQSQTYTEDSIRNRDLRQENDELLRFKDFSLTFYGDYTHLKSVVESLEVNAYPLEVVELTFSSAPDPEQVAEDLGLEPGVMKYDITLRAYALPGV